MDTTEKIQEISQISESVVESIPADASEDSKEPPVDKVFTEKLEEFQIIGSVQQPLDASESKAIDQEPTVDTSSIVPLEDGRTETPIQDSNDFIPMVNVTEERQNLVYYGREDDSLVETKTERSNVQIQDSVNFKDDVQHVHSLPPGVPAGPSFVQQFDVSSEDEILTETVEISVDLVGRVIGKGGEQIRDLQARSDCKVDVDQSGPQGAPKIITYQGTRAKIDFAKSLVKIVCSHRGGMGNVDLPLGYAAKKQIQVPSTVIGKIIGRNGDMIKELQTKSQCKIQVDHSQVNDPSAPRSVTIIGNPNAVTRAEEMVHIIIANPQADASNTIDLLIREKNQGASKWGSGPPYSTMPNGGQGMLGSGGSSSWSQSLDKYGQQPQTYGHPSSQSYGNASSSALRTEVFYSAKMYMGRIIGSKGVTINDIQKQSGCDIQINQNVPQGRDCEITIKGNIKGIEQAKKMLNDIISMGPNHPYAGGRGSSGSSAYASQSYTGGAFSNQTTYETPHYAPAQNQYGQVTSSYTHLQQQQTGYQNYQPQQYTQHQVILPQHQPVLQQAYQPQSYGAYQQHSQPQHQPVYYGSQPASYVPQVSYQAPIVNTVSNWKSATTPEGQVYYYNSSTGETTWEKPPGMY